MLLQEEIDRFVDELRPAQVAMDLMNTLPGVITYIKNVSGVYMFVNRAFAETLQLSVENIVGKTDRDLFSPELAKMYQADDAEVCRTGGRILEKTELVTYRPGLVRWYVTNKIPLLNRNDEIVGMAGLSRPSATHESMIQGGAMSSISNAVDFVYQHMNTLVSVETIAEACGCSLSSLERYFKKHFNLTPGKFVAQVKMTHACELLAEPSLSISEIGDRIGYPDPVVFSRAFKREMRVSPSAYRKSLGH